MDRIGDACVLLIEPSDSLGNEYCKRFCGNSAGGPDDCTGGNFGIVLGLPFMHRFCIYYDESQMNSRLAWQKTNVLRSACEYDQHGTRPTTRSSRSTTSESGQSTQLSTLSHEGTTATTTTAVRTVSTGLNQPARGTKLHLVCSTYSRRLRAPGPRGSDCSVRCRPGHLNSRDDSYVVLLPSTTTTSEKQV